MQGSGPTNLLCFKSYFTILSFIQKVLLYNWSDEAVVGKYKGPEKDITQVSVTMEWGYVKFYYKKSVNKTNIARCCFFSLTCCFTLKPTNSCW